MPPLLTPPDDALAIIHRLRRAGFVAFFCGGCVRDALLGARPKDFDIATAATPDQIEALFARTVPVGKAFGVMIVLGEDGSGYEVATFRADAGYADGRRPDAVRFTSAAEDARRRDFTMNALFYDPDAERVIDYVGGQEDIARRLLRTVGEPAERFREDHLRLLRAARFAARTGFAIEPTTARAMADLAGLVTTVSPERIAAELEGMLTGGQSRRAFAILESTGLLGMVLPEVAAMAGVPQPPDFHPEGDVWTHTSIILDLNDQAVRGDVRALDHSDSDSGRAGMGRGNFTGAEYLAGVHDCRQVMTAGQVLALSWSGLLHDIGKPATITMADRIRFNDHDRLGGEMATAILERLRRPRKIIDMTHDLIRRHMHLATLRKMRRSKLRRWLAEPSFPLHLELHRMDCVASHAMLANWFFGLEAWREERARPPAPEPLVRGKDILALGVPAGPEVGRLLRLIEDARLEGTIQDRDEALALAVREAEGEGSLPLPCQRTHSLPADR
ncbi:MAG: HD domain-containing protein [Planctomycetes bacterium]|nr:HD domain-containing protein [Planctomycetota bacterium]